MQAQTIVCFKALDSFMEEYKKNPTVFSELYDQKIKLLGFVDSGKMDGKKYHLLCKKVLAESEKYGYINNIVRKSKAILRCSLSVLMEILMDGLKM